MTICLLFQPLVISFQQRLNQILLWTHDLVPNWVSLVPRIPCLLMDIRGFPILPVPNPISLMNSRKTLVRTSLNHPSFPFLFNLAVFLSILPRFFSLHLLIGYAFNFRSCSSAIISLGSLVWWIAVWLFAVLASNVVMPGFPVIIFIRGLYVVISIDCRLCNPPSYLSSPLLLFLSLFPHSSSLLFPLLLPSSSFFFSFSFLCCLFSFLEFLLVTSTISPNRHLRSHLFLWFSVFVLSCWEALHISWARDVVFNERFDASFSTSLHFYRYLCSYSAALQFSFRSMWRTRMRQNLMHRLAMCNSISKAQAALLWLFTHAPL